MLADFNNFGAVDVILLLEAIKLAFWDLKSNIYISYASQINHLWYY